MSLWYHQDTFLSRSIRGRDLLNIFRPSRLMDGYDVSKAFRRLAGGFPILSSPCLFFSYWFPIFYNSSSPVFIFTCSPSLVLKVKVLIFNLSYLVASVCNTFQCASKTWAIFLFCLIIHGPSLWLFLHDSSSWLCFLISRAYSVPG